VKLYEAEHPVKLDEAEYPVQGHVVGYYLKVVTFQIWPELPD